MEDFASQIFMLPPPFNMIVLVMGLICIGQAVNTLINNVRRYADREADRRMKLEMIRCGVSVEEAERWARIGGDPREAATVAYDSSGDDAEVDLRLQTRDSGRERA